MAGSWLCLGLAVAGICLPVPGTSRSAIANAGWAIGRDELHPDEWWASASLARGSTSLLASVGGHDEKALSLLLATKDAAMTEAIRSALGSVCESGDGGVVRRCKLGSGAAFTLVTCTQSMGTTTTTKDCSPSPPPPNRKGLCSRLFWGALATCSLGATGVSWTQRVTGPDRTGPIWGPIAQQGRVCLYEAVMCQQECNAGGNTCLELYLLGLPMGRAARRLSP